MAVLTRDAILQREDMRPELVDVPEWGGSVYVRPLTGFEREQFEKSLVPESPNGKAGRRRRKSADVTAAMGTVRARLCALCIVDKDGTRLFTDEDIEALGNKSAAATSRIFDRAAELSGIMEKDVDDLAESMTKDPSDGTS